MKGVLILAHGSREKEAEKAFETVVDMVRDRVDAPVETAYMDFSGQTIAAGLQRLADRGADDIRVVPCFLFSGIHVQKNIPAALATFSQEHPGIAVSVAETLGPDPRIAEILLDRIG